MGERGERGGSEGQKGTVNVKKTSLRGEMSAERAER